MDADDPFFTPREVELLRAARLRAYVVTAERAARRYEALGVDKPWVVIPQGVSLSSARPSRSPRRPRAERRARSSSAGWRRTCSTDGDRGGEARSTTSTTCSSCGTRSTRACRTPASGSSASRASGSSRRVAGRADIVLFGRLPREQALATAAKFDVALYARTQDKGIQAAKVGGVHRSRRPDGVVRLRGDREPARDGSRDPRADAAGVRRRGRPPARGRRGAAELAAAARRAGVDLDWDVLARRFEPEVLDRYLPR